MHSHVNTLFDIIYIHLASDLHDFIPCQLQIHWRALKGREQAFYYLQKLQHRNILRMEVFKECLGGHWNIWENHLLLKKIEKLKAKFFKLHFFFS